MRIMMMKGWWLFVCLVLGSSLVVVVGIKEPPRLRRKLGDANDEMQPSLYIVNRKDDHGLHQSVVVTVNGVIESVDCVPYRKVDTERAHKATDDECVNQDGCSNGCCRLVGGDHLKCDTSNDHMDLACVCNADVTRTPGMFDGYWTLTVGGVTQTYPKPQDLGFESGIEARKGGNGGKDKDKDKDKGSKDSTSEQQEAVSTPTVVSSAVEAPAPTSPTYVSPQGAVVTGVQIISSGSAPLSSPNNTTDSGSNTTENGGSTGGSTIAVDAGDATVVINPGGPSGPAPAGPPLTELLPVTTEITIAPTANPGMGMDMPESLPQTMMPTVPANTPMPSFASTPMPSLASTTMPSDSATTSTADSSQQTGGDSIAATFAPQPGSVLSSACQQGSWYWQIPNSELTQCRTTSDDCNQARGECCLVQFCMCGKHNGRIVDSCVPSYDLDLLTSLSRNGP